MENDLKVLKVKANDLNVSVRDISLNDMFMLKVDKDSHSPVREVEQGLKSKNSSASSKSSTEPAQPFYIKKRKLKDLADEYLNA